MLRSHYPLHPYFHELADRMGFLVWSEIPMYAIKTELPQERDRAQDRRERAARQHPGQRQPPVGRRRGRSATSCRRGPARCRATTCAARPTRPARSTRRGRSPTPSPATPAPAARPSTRRSTSSASTSTSAGTRARTGRSPTARCSASTSTAVRACYPNKGDHRSPSSARRPTAAARSRRRARSSSSQDFINYHLGVYNYEALAERRAVLDAEGVPRPARVGRRQPAARSRPSTRRPSSTSTACASPAFTDLQRGYQAVDQYPGQPCAGAFGRTALPSNAAMANESTRLNATVREIEGSRANRRLRREGRVPAVLYGGGDEPVALSVDAARAAPRAARRRARCSSSTVDGQTQNAVVKDLQRHPVRDEAMHIDFVRVRMDVAIQSIVTLELVGAEEAPGIDEGGVLEQQLREVNVEALPGDIPETIEHDVSQPGDGRDRARSPTSPRRTASRSSTTPRLVVASITLPRLEVETDEAETETELVGEGEEGAEGEAAEGESAEGAGRGRLRVVRLRQRVTLLRALRPPGLGAGRLARRRPGEPRAPATRGRRTTWASRSPTRSRAAGTSRRRRRSSTASLTEGRTGPGGPRVARPAAADVHERGRPLGRPRPRRVHASTTSRACSSCTTRSTCRSATSAPASAAAWPATTA